jgi:two-component system chemotaxis response regulator CheB
LARYDAERRNEEDMENALRVLIVDDTVTYRKIVADVLAACPGVEVVGTAANGKIALQRLEQQAADLLVLDLEMPEMNGQAVLEELRRRKSPAGAIMLSAFTAQGAKATLAALEAGAFDFVLKPSGASMQANVEHLRRELHGKLAAYARQRSVQQILYGSKGEGEKGRKSPFLPFSPAFPRAAASRGLGDFHGRAQGPDRDGAAVAGQPARAAASGPVRRATARCSRRSSTPSPRRKRSSFATAAPSTPCRTASCPT